MKSTFLENLIDFAQFSMQQPETWIVIPCIVTGIFDDNSTFIEIPATPFSEKIETPLGVYDTKLALIVLGTVSVWIRVAIKYMS